MDKPISQSLKHLFLIHCIVGVVFGLTYLLIPETYGDIVNWPVKDPVAFRLIGAALMGFGISSWFAFKAPSWKSVRILVLMEIAWCGLGTIVMLWGMISQGLPVIGWMNTAIMAIFTVTFAIFLVREK